MAGILPKEVFLTSGIGVHKEKLYSFELALRDSGIAKLNLVRVSSIFPPNCKIIEKEEGRLKLQPGEIVFCVLSDNATNEPYRAISASVGIAVPDDPGKHGYLSEHHSFGQTKDIAGDYAEDLAAAMLASTFGIKENIEWEEEKEIWKLREDIVRTTNVTASEEGHPEGLWTTVLAAAIFIC